MEKINTKKQLDRAIGNFRKKELTVLFAATADGKSSFKTWLAANAINNGHNVFYASLENRPSNILDKVERAHTKNLSESSGKLVVREFNLLEDNFYFKICNSLSALRKKGEYPDIVFVDYVDLIGKTKSDEHHSDTFNNNILLLKEIAVEYDVAMVTSSQIARNSFDKSNRLSIKNFNFNNEIYNSIDIGIVLRAIRDSESAIVSTEDNYHNFNVDIIKIREKQVFICLKANYNFASNHIDFFEDYHLVDNFFSSLMAKMSNVGVLVFNDHEVEEIFTAYFVNSIINMRKNVLYCTFNKDKIFLEQLATSYNYQHAFTGEIFIHTLDGINPKNDIETLVKKSENIEYVVINGLDNVETKDYNEQKSIYEFLHGLSLETNIDFIITSEVEKTKKKSREIQVSDISNTISKVVIANYVLAVSSCWPLWWPLRIFRRKDVYGAKVLKSRVGKFGVYYKLKIDKTLRWVKYLNKKKNE